jgi:hypothetical protein
LVTAPVSSQERGRALRIEACCRIQTVGGAALSPSGRWVSHTVSTRLEDENGTRATGGNNESVRSTSARRLSTFASQPDVVNEVVALGEGAFRTLSEFVAMSVSLFRSHVVGEDGDQIRTGDRRQLLGLRNAVVIGSRQSSNAGKGALPC